MNDATDDVFADQVAAVDFEANADAATLEAFGARHVPTRLRHVPGILARRLWQLNREELWERLVEQRAAHRHAVPDTTEPDAAVDCIAFLHHEYSAEGLPGSLDVSERDLTYERYDHGLHPDTIRTIALNGHVGLLEAIARQNLENHDWDERDDPWLALPLTEADVDACARLGAVKTLQTLYRHVPKLFSPFAQRVLHAPPRQVTTTLDEDTPPISERGTHLDPVPPPAMAYSVVHDVLTNSVLLQCIGAFQFDIHKWMDEVEPLYEVPGDKTIDDIVGILPRLAIIQGDEFALRRLYQLAILPKNSSIPKFSFVNAMHDAATEGHLAMLQWLHTLRPRLACRPDTMAMTVRSGWADVVEWLCEHARESACLSMTDAPVRDAAHWGFLDVLRVLHEHGEDAWFSPNVMGSAAASGQLAIVQWLHTNHPESCSKVALSDALLRGHHHVVDWLADHCEVDVEFHILSGAIASGDERRMTAALALWRQRRDDPEVRRAVQSGFERACAIHSDNVNVIRLIVDACGGELELGAGILNASRTRGASVVMLLAPMVDPRVALQAGLQCDLKTVVMEAITRAGVDDNSNVPTAMPSSFLVETLRESIAMKRTGAVLGFAELDINAVKQLLMEKLDRCWSEPRHRDRALQVLLRATSTERTEFLLEASNTIGALPKWVALEFLRCTLEGREPLKWGDVSPQQRAKPLSPEELARLTDMDDRELEALVTAHPKTIVHPDAHLVAAANGNLKLMRFLHERGGVAPTSSAFGPAIGRQHVHVVEWLLSLGLELTTGNARFLQKRPEHPVAVALAGRLPPPIDTTLPSQ